MSSEPSRRSLEAVREELEVARQEAAQVLDCLCAERESRAQDALQLKDTVPLSKHKEALASMSEQLARTLQELQEEKVVRAQAEEQAAALEARLQAMVDKEEHESIKVLLGQKCSSRVHSSFRIKEEMIFCHPVLFKHFFCPSCPSGRAAALSAGQREQLGSSPGGSE